jgi:hypothetical protein
MAFGKFISVGQAQIGILHSSDLLQHALFPVLPVCEVIVLL